MSKRKTVTKREAQKLVGLLGWLLLAGLFLVLFGISQIVKQCNPPTSSANQWGFPESKSATPIAPVAAPIAAPIAAPAAAAAPPTPTPLEELPNSLVCCKKCAADESPCGDLCFKKHLKCYSSLGCACSEKDPRPIRAYKPEVHHVAPSPSTSRCCKHCGASSKPCGDSCISLSKQCHKSGGCAC